MCKNSLFFAAVFFSYSLYASKLEVEWQHYHSKPALKSQLQDYISVKWDQKTNFHFDPVYLNSHVFLEYYLDASKLLHFDVHEFYASYKYDLKNSFYSITSLEFNVGRKLKDWSVADTYWGMDLWQPLSLWNPLHPRSSGLIGFFSTVHATKWSFDLLVSPVYIPNQEAKFETRNGDIVSSSRWWFPAPGQVDMNKYGYVDIYYLTEEYYPSHFDVMLQPSYLFSFKTWSKWPQTYYWIKLSFANKPVNHLFYVLKKDHVFDIGKDENALGVVYQNISVLPVRGTLLSLQFGVDYKSFSCVFSLENSRMKEVNLSPEGWDFLNERANFSYFSSILKYEFWKSSFIQVGYLHTWFKNYNPKNVIVGQKTPSVLHRYKLLEGLSFDIHTEFLSTKELQRVFTLKYQYSFLNSGGWLFAETLYFFSENIYAAVAVNILGAKKKKNHFLNHFSHNDYFSLRLAYEF